MRASWRMRAARFTAAMGSHANAEVAPRAVRQERLQAPPTGAPPGVERVDDDGAPERVGRVPDRSRAEPVDRVAAVEELSPQMVEAAGVDPVRLHPQKRQRAG